MDIVSYIKRIDLRYRITFISSIIIGILSQGMGLFNKFSVHDDIGQIFGVSATYISGRWMLQVLADFEKLFFGGTGHYSLPIFNGFSSIICIAVASSLVVYLLKIKKQLFCIFIGGVMVAFPVVTGTFNYMFTAHFYFFAMMCGVLGTTLICTGNRIWKRGIGILLIAASIGVYQAFIPEYLCLMLCYVLLKFLDCSDFRKTYFIFMKISACCILFMALYFFLTKLALYFTGNELTDYLGISKMGGQRLFLYIF